MQTLYRVRVPFPSYFAVYHLFFVYDFVRENEQKLKKDPWLCRSARLRMLLRGDQILLTAQNRDATAYLHFFPILFFFCRVTYASPTSLKTTNKQKVSWIREVVPALQKELRLEKKIERTRKRYEAQHRRHSERKGYVSRQEAVYEFKIHPCTRGVYTTSDARRGREYFFFIPKGVRM